jgi:hypothetical protein
MSSWSGNKGIPISVMCCSHAVGHHPDLRRPHGKRYARDQPDQSIHPNAIGKVSRCDLIHPDEDRRDQDQTNQGRHQNQQPQDDRDQRRHGMSGFV